MRAAAGALVAVLLVAGCSKPAPPVGRWEGTYQSDTTLVVARVEIDAQGLVRLSAPNAENVPAGADERAITRQSLSAGLASGWDTVAPRVMDFNGHVFRRPGGVAPQMIWDKDRKRMSVVVYIGMNPALTFPLRAVDDFSDDPWPSG